MSMKSEFVFKFPKLGTEQKATANPMHVEAVTSIIMVENDTDLCMVYFGETLQFICVYADKVGFQYFYKDNTKKTDLYLVYGPDELIELIDSDDMDEAAKEADIETLSNIVATRRPSFYTEEEATAYCRGVDDAMCICDRDDNYRFVEEDKYYKLKEVLGL